LDVVDDARWEILSRKAEAVASETARLTQLWASPNNALGQAFAAGTGIALSRESTVLDLIRRPELDYAQLMAIPGIGPGVADPKVAEQVEITAKYSGYLDRQGEEIEKQRRHEDTTIPSDFEYSGLAGLSAELQGKLAQVRPETIGQAKRIPGMTPAAVSLLLVHVSKRRRVA
jgi:tRNA uridine 5-carboxymethylaminomethyl modification enzyme